MELKEFKGVLVRPTSPCDKEMVNDCFKNYSAFTFTPKSRVLDLGVFVGGFAVMAKQAGVAKYVGVEADEDNYKVAQENLNRFEDGNEAYILLGAASCSEADTLTFYQTGSGRSKCGGTVSTNNHGKALRPVENVVKNFNLKKLIADVKPTILKMDIEGTEHDFFAENGGVIPKCIKEFAVEIHKFKSILAFSEKYLPRMLQDFELISAKPAIGFAKSTTKKFAVPNLNISGTGTLYGVDCFFRRK